MKISVIAAIFTLLMCGFLFFTACQTTEIGNDNYKKIIDSYGREVKVPRDIQKIATVGAATRLVVYAGAQDKLVAITDMDRPTELRPYTLAYPELFSSLPSTNNGNHINSTNVDKEKIIEIAPDVIISTRSADECKQLQNDTKIPVVGIDYGTNFQYDTFTSVLKIVGEACNSSEKANTLSGYFKSIINECDMKAGGSTIPIYRGAINYKGSKDLTGTFSQYFPYTNLRMNNVADLPNFSGAYDTTLEQILAWNPEYIFMDYTNKDKVKNQMDENPSVFANLRAFKNSKVYFCAPYNNNGTNFEYAMCEILMTAKVLYPEAFNNVDLDERYSEIFEKFLGKNIWPELLSRGVYFGPAKF